MEIVFQSHRVSKPVLSIVLLDWSCRESFHIFDYLAAQEVARDKFEVLWIEYYDRRSEEIKKVISKSRIAESHPLIDKWIVLDLPRELYYHKHLMYNVGIVASARGLSRLHLRTVRDDLAAGERWEERDVA